MATPQAAEQLLDPQLIAHLTASKYYMLASIVILYFDYFLTFDLEIENLWKRRFTGPTILFLLNRYYPMMFYVVILVAVHDRSWSGEAHFIPRCENFKRFPLIAALVSEAIIGVIVMLRLYALYSRSSRIIFLLVPLYVLQLMVGGWASDALERVIGLPPGSGCIVSVPHEYSGRFAWLWGSSAVFDTLVFGLTIYRTLNLRRSGLKLPLTTLFLRDGIVYFAVMGSARLLNFVLYWNDISPDLVTLNWTFNNTITVIMMNRLVLNLRQEGSKDVIFSETPNNAIPAESFMHTFITELGKSIPTRAEVEETGAFEKMKDEDGEHSITRPAVRVNPLVKLEEGWSQ